MNTKGFKTLQSFGEATRNDIVTIDLANHKQEQLPKRSNNL